ncbi:elongation factor Tu GTP binding domain containing protein [Acanthamoeba castellanii str. Neff]|uniref:Elongation factor Tu GTP binding domain containing protein n=1 Tax=Acanthamoeba castellanii (strain ATCC 30010 / Neff) TaxID=1257118 RepID=L8GN76_ACACF|nr:elongation factor Tu GTP binding domain containing protein [Acanthamoeba castellanii str. Neff]ELR13666.1 elongation factor Tu GTP binding domain containing protein [Acanthamoeba castellanii str. Neff]
MVWHPLVEGREKIVKEAKLPPFIRARELAKKLGINLKDITRRLTSEGLRFKTPKDLIFSWEATSQFAESIGIEPVFDDPDLRRDAVSHRERRKAGPAGQVIGKGMVLRPGIVSVMGHVDHGKTTLLDALRNTNVAAREAGGITQRLSAFKQQQPGEESNHGKAITFLDTPGHKAFFRMRSNGAYLSDMVVLIIACDEGIKPQTKESYDLALESELPVVIALNKIDLPVDTSKIKRRLERLGWVPSPSGTAATNSSTAPPSNVRAVVEISAKERRNLDVLVSTLANTCREMNLWEDTTCPPEATVVEVWSEDGSRGRVLKVIVHCGVLEVGQHFVVGYQAGRVRAIFDEDRKQVERAMPGDPVEIVGLYRGTLPSPGDDLFVVSRDKAEQVVEFRNLVTDFQGTEGKYDQALINSIHRESAHSAEDTDEQTNEGEEEEEGDDEEEEEDEDEKATVPYEEEEEPVVNVVLKADNLGSLYTLVDACNELSSQGGPKVNIVRAGVGNVSATDVAYATSAECAIYTFNVGLTHDIKLRKVNNKLKIRIKHFDVFYHLLDDLKKEQDALR